MTFRQLPCLIYLRLKAREIPENNRSVHLAYKPYFFSQQTIFFSYNKSASAMAYQPNEQGEHHYPPKHIPLPGAFPFLL